MFKCKWKYCFSLALFIVNTLLSATPVWALTAKTGWVNPVFTLSSGVGIAKLGTSQSLSMPSDFTQYNYTIGNSHSTQMLWGVFVGTEIPLRPLWAAQVGIGFYQPSSFNTKSGVLTQGVDAASSDRYPYNYNVKSRQLLLEAKLLWQYKERFHPYALVGLGAAFNNTYGFDVNIPPCCSCSTFTPAFTNQNTTSFSYSVGLGIDVDIEKNWRAGVGYRFAGLGKANLGLGFIDTTPFSSTLKQSNLYAQEILAHLTYLVG
jgi:opacity protein-like surface antigen